MLLLLQRTSICQFRARGVPVLLLGPMSCPLGTQQRELVRAWRVVGRVGLALRSNPHFPDKTWHCLAAHMPLQVHLLLLPPLLLSSGCLASAFSQILTASLELPALGFDLFNISLFFH